MEEKKIIVKFDKATVELQSNNPNIKNLVEKILEQDEKFDFNNTEIECLDDSFDKNAFKTIIVDSIKEFKQQLIIEEKSNIDKLEKIKKEKQKIE